MQEQIRLRTDELVVHETEIAEQQADTPAWDDFNRVVEDLRVHQIELEMQNEELRTAHEELRRTRDGLEELFDHAPVGYITVTYGWIVKQVNLTFLEMLDVPRDRVQGRPFFRLVSDKDRQEFFLRAKHFLEDVNDQVMEVNLQREDGTSFPAEIRGRRVDAGETLCRLSISDITSRKRVEDQLRVARVAAESANRAKSTFLATMSHEIRTPLNAVIGFADILAQTNLSDEQTEYVAQIHSAGDHLISLINDILDYSRMQAGRLLLNSRPVDVNLLLESVRKMFAPEANGAELDFKVTFRNELTIPAVLGDERRIRQILINLIGNALKFTEKGGVEVLVDWSEKDDRAIAIDIAVRDSGVGIAAHNLEKIFEPFQQGDPEASSKPSGTGLGLAICKRIAERMDGQLRVESTLGVGSTFHLELHLPLESELDYEQLGSGGLPGMPGAEKPLALRVLAVDDFAGNRRVIEAYLDRFGCRSVIAPSAEAAVDCLRMQPFDLVLLDLRMPGLSGFEIAENLRKGEYGPANQSTRLVAVSALSQDEDRERARAAGIDEFVLKPVRMETMRQVVNRAASLLEQQS